MLLVQKHRPESRSRSATKHHQKTLSRQSNHRTRRQRLCQNVHNNSRINFENYLDVRIGVDRPGSASKLSRSESPSKLQIPNAPCSDQVLTNHHWGSNTREERNQIWPLLSSGVAVIGNADRIKNRVIRVFWSGLCSLIQWEWPAEGGRQVGLGKRRR